MPIFAARYPVTQTSSIQKNGVFKAALNWGLPVFVVEFDVTYYFYTVSRKGQQTFFAKT